MSLHFKFYFIRKYTMKYNGLGGSGKGLTMKPTIMRMTMDNDMDQDDEMNYVPDMDMVGDFGGRLLMSAPIIHMLHLQTDSFAKHLALGELYDSLPDTTDVVLEEFQGCYSIISSYNTYVTYTANPTIFVEDLLDYVRKNRHCMGPSTSINSNIDIIETSIKACLYKLKNLK